ncbi:hypothetical protein M885DRAFT_548066 [Pelagophyceae sp. CCMP2097]|nr:hypothetical protein M885DRAFT_548066 [Pelagophyceae sp. CCMP2097]
MNPRRRPEGRIAAFGFAGPFRSTQRPSWNPSFRSLRPFCCGRRNSRGALLSHPEGPVPRPEGILRRRRFRPCLRQRIGGPDFLLRRPKTSERIGRGPETHWFRDVSRRTSGGAQASRAFKAFPANPFQRRLSSGPFPTVFSQKGQSQGLTSAALRLFRNSKRPQTKHGAILFGRATSPRGPQRHTWRLFLQTAGTPKTAPSRSGRRAVVSGRKTPFK